MNEPSSLTIGCIGQGWIGRNYADYFEEQGFAVVRYALEPEYEGNKGRIAECDIVVIAVPTPTTPEGFDGSVVRAVLPLVGVGKIAVIKSTLVPGTTDELQAAFPDRIVLHSPEFLREASAAKDVREPERNIIGVPLDTPEHYRAAETVRRIFAPAPYNAVVPARTAELIKYAGNVFLAIKVVFANLLYDLAGKLDVPYGDVQAALGADSRICPSHLNPISASGHTTKEGRGAGGHCFIKDLEAFRRLYREAAGDPEGVALLDSIVAKNTRLLTDSGKDLDLLEQVYGTIA